MRYSIALELETVPTPPIVLALDRYHSLFYLISHNIRKDCQQEAVEDYTYPFILCFIRPAPVISEAE